MSSHVWANGAWAEVWGNYVWAGLGGPPPAGPSVRVWAEGVWATTPAWADGVWFGMSAQAPAPEAAPSVGLGTSAQRGWRRRSFSYWDTRPQAKDERLPKRKRIALALTL